MMRQFRAPIAGLMAAVAAVAVNLSTMRSYDASSPHSLPHLLFACGVLPMASLLIFVAVTSAAGLRRGQRLAPFLVGFEAFGWAGVFAFLPFHSVATSSLLRYTGLIGAMIRPVVGPYIAAAPSCTPWLFEFGFSTVLFSLPQLLLGLVGGWLARMSGFTAREKRQPDHRMDP